MSAAVEIQNPFPGLRPFKTEESTLFFGRDEQIGEALDRILRRKLLAVVGVSGCGKSSLVSAGMIPALEMGLAGNPEQHWHVAAMRPGDGPLRELARCLGFGGTLAERTYGLQEAVEAHLPAGHSLLLLVDQFEEIFPFRDRKLRDGGGSEADLFVSYLLRAAQDQAGRVYVLLTMRSDYLGECAKFHGLPEALNDGQYLVPRMTRQQLQEAIEGPIEAVSVQMHPALVQELLNQCDEEPDNLPLLQHLLRRMFEEWAVKGGRGVITSAMAACVGGLSGALNQDAEKVCDGLSIDELRIAEGLFRRITESRRQADTAEDDRPVRRPQTVDHLAKLARVEESALRDVVNRFEQRGLLVLRQTDQGDKVDLPHECLCLRWARLKEWIRVEAEDAKKLRFLWDATERKAPLAGLALDEAIEWQRNGRLGTLWCSRYLNSEQIVAVTGWVTESDRVVGEAAERERQAQEAERSRAEERRALAEQERLRELEKQGAERRSRRVTTAALLLGLLALAFAGLGTWAYEQSGIARKEAIKADEQRTTANLEREKADREKGRASAAESDAKFNLSLANKSRREAQEATARALESERKSRDLAELYLSSQLASKSDSVFREDQSSLETAVLLAIESVRWRPSLDGERALRQAMNLLPARRLAWTHGKTQAVTFSPDARWVATEAAVFEAATGKEIARVPLRSIPGAVAISPDSKWVAAACADGFVRVLERTTGAEVKSLPAEGMKAVAFSASGDLLAMADNQAVYVRDVQAWHVVKQFSVQAGTRALAFSADGRWLAAGTDDKTVHVIEMATAIQTTFGRGREVNAVAFSPDGKWLATGSDDNIARVFGIETGKEVFRSQHQGKVRAVAFSRNGKWLATGSEDKTARLLDVASGREMARLPHNGAVSAVAFTADGKSVETWSDDGAVQVMELPSSKQWIPLLNQTEANTAAFSPDGRWVATGSKDSIARILETATGKVTREVGHRSEVLAVAFSPDGKSLLTRTKDKAARVINVATGNSVPGPVDQRVVLSIAISPGGQFMAAGGDDNIARVTDMARGQLVSTIKHNAPVYAVAFSPDGKSLLTGAEDTKAVLWDLAKPREIWRVNHPGRVYAAAFSADGKLFATGGGSSAKVMDVATGRELHRIDIEAGIFAAAHFSRDGRWLETIHQVSELDTGLIYSRHLLDTQEMIREACNAVSRNLTTSEWQQYAREIPYRRTCENRPGASVSQTVGHQDFQAMPAIGQP